MRKVIIRIWILLILVSCSEYPKEKLEFYDDGTIKVKSLSYNSEGKKDEFYFSPSGKLTHEYNWMDDCGNGIYKSYFENTQLRELFTLKNGKYEGAAQRFYESGEKMSIGHCIDGNVAYTKSYDKNGVVYHEYFEDGREVLYRYYKDTSTYEITYIKPVYLDDQNIEKIIQDSVKYFDFSGRLVLKVMRSESYGLAQVYDSLGNVSKIDTIETNKQVMLMAKKLIGADTIKLHYEFKMK